MTLQRPSTSLRLTLRGAPLVALLAALAAAMPAFAQYKVIGPDGKVTYTDRPPTSSEGKATPLGARAGAPEPAAVAMPIELRQPVARYPVSLYVTTGACDPCNSARQMLRQRGIPYAEKQVLSGEDTEALERLSGGRDVPALSIGSQTLRGFSPDVWASYLDAAGYPRESRLPTTYQYPAATPMVERARTARAPEAPAEPTPAAPTPPPANPSGIKF